MMFAGCITPRENGLIRQRLLGSTRRSDLDHTMAATLVQWRDGEKSVRARSGEWGDDTARA